MMMDLGTVTWFDAKIGYGYISPDDGTPDVFVHFTALDLAGLNTLGKGQRVRYRPAREGGVTRATNLQVMVAA